VGGRRGQQATKYWDLNRRGYYIERSGGLTAASKNGPYVETELGVAPRPRHLYRDDAALSFPLGLPEDGIGWLHQPFPPARHHLGHHRVEDDLTLEVQSLRPQRVPAGEFDLGAWNRECEVWQRDATVGESEAAAEIGDDVFAPGIVGVAAGALAQFVDLPLHIVVGERRLCDFEPAVEAQSLRDVGLARRQHELRRQSK